MNLKTVGYTGSKSESQMHHFLSHLPPLNLPAQTVNRLRKGQGRLSVLTDALREAGYELRPTPEALAVRYGQREAARKAALSRNTIAALAAGQGTVASYLALAEALKVVPRIVKRKNFAACLSSVSFRQGCVNRLGHRTDRLIGGFRAGVLLGERRLVVPGHPVGRVRGDRVPVTL